MNDNELAERTEENLDLLRQRETYQYQIAIKNIEETARNNREIREHFNTINLRAVLLVGFFALCVLIFGMYALYLGKENIISDILKIALGAFGGGGLGYAVGSRKRTE